MRLQMSLIMSGRWTFEDRHFYMFFTSPIKSMCLCAYFVMEGIITILVFFFFFVFFLAWCPKSFFTFPQYCAKGLCYQIIFALFQVSCLSIAIIIATAIIEKDRPEGKHCMCILYEGPQDMLRVSHFLCYLRLPLALLMHSVVMNTL